MASTRLLRRWPVHRAGAIAAVAATLLAVVGGCGKDEPAASKITDLTISVLAEPGAEPRTLSLTCAPAGGDHPQAAQACAMLEKAGAAIFEPVPGDQVCTEIYGGPQTATITGTYAGEPVDASFNRANGCEIDRWEKLGTTVFDLPLQ